MINDDGFEVAAEKLLKEYRIASDQLIVDITLSTKLWSEYLSCYGSFEELTKGLEIDGIHNNLRYVIIHNYMTESEMIFRKGILVPCICDEIPFINDDERDRVRKVTDLLGVSQQGADLYEHRGCLSYSIPLLGSDSSPFAAEKFKQDPRYVPDVPLMGGPDRLVLMELNLGLLRQLFRNIYLEKQYPEDPDAYAIEQDKLASLAKHIQYNPEEYHRNAYSDAKNISHVFKNEYIEVTVGYSCDESYFLDSLIDLFRDALSPSR